LSGESLLSFWRFEPMLGAAPCPQLDRCAQNFCGVIDYVIQFTKVESFAFLTRLVLEIKNRQYRISYSCTADTWCLTALIVKSRKTWR